MSSKGEAAWVAQEHLLETSSGGLLPALVIGAEMPNAGAPAPMPEKARSDRRYGEVLLDHQYGGDRCSRRVISGLLLPLHENLDRAESKSEAKEFLDALRLRAESVAVEDRNHPTPALPQNPMHTGQAMNGDELRVYQELLKETFALPRPEYGFEAFLDLGLAKPDLLVGWSAVWFGIGDDGYLHPVDRKPVRENHVKMGDKPHLWLLWENCD